MESIIIQNVDKAVSARDYNALGNDILVSSYFATIQGEGPFTGYPAMFVRLAGCNYGDKNKYCQGCDTDFRVANGVRYAPAALLEVLLNDPGYHPSQVLVITGGEPTLQLNLLAFIVKAHGRFKDIQLETNGTQPKFYRAAVERNCTSYFKSVVSPKANLIHMNYPKVSSDVSWWATCFKFVLSADPASAHHTIPEHYLRLPRQIYVSPQAVYKRPYTGEVSSIWDKDLIDQDATARNYAYAAAYAMKHHLLLSLQTHLFLNLP